MNATNMRYYCFLIILMIITSCASEPKNTEEIIPSNIITEEDSSVEKSAQLAGRDTVTANNISKESVNDAPSGEEETKAKLIAAELEKEKEKKEKLALAKKKRREERRRKRREKRAQERAQQKREEEARIAKEREKKKEKEAEKEILVAKGKAEDLSGIDPELLDIVQVKETGGGMPIVQFKEKVYNFGRIQQGEKVVHEFIFTNVGSSPLVIEDVQATCGCTMPFYPFVPIPPGKSNKIQVQFDSKGRLGSQNPVVTITTNAKPRTYEVSLKGVVDTDRQ